MSIQKTMEEVKKNPHLATYYSKKQCKFCHGRGIIDREFFSEFGWTKKKDICYCAKNGILKHAKQ